MKLDINKQFIYYLESDRIMKMTYDGLDEEVLVLVPEIINSFVLSQPGDMLYYNLKQKVMRRSLSDRQSHLVVDLHNTLKLEDHYKERLYFSIRFNLYYLDLKNTCNIVQIYNNI